jgi:maltooligosyltrehalose trehalohydrolase
MQSFEVWAPAAQSVAVRCGAQEWPLCAGDDGWWRCAVNAAGPGSDYAFVVDGLEPAVPDPRSAWQPHGVHGPSRVVDHKAFPWTDEGWWAEALADAVIYELHVGTFTPEGTFDAAAERLGYLKELGITHVELMPVNGFPGKHGWGYDGVNLYAPQQSYGGPEGLKRFVNACHATGMAALLDVVYNHLGPSGNYLGRFGPYFTALHHTPWGDAVNLEDASSYEVRRFFVDNALMWLRDYHFDGLRLDAVHAYMDRSAIHFMEQLSTAVRGLEAETERRYVVIAESDLNDPRVVMPPKRGGYGLDAQWSDDFHHALVTVLTGDRGGYYLDFGSMADLAKALKQVFVYDGRYSPYRDQVHGRPVEGVEAWRFLGYAQNHDQVGNRAKGERLSHLTTPGRAKIAAALVMTSPFVPMIFQGEEWASSSPFLYFTDHEDEELGRLVSEGRKREFAAFGWNPEEIPDPQSRDAFAESQLRWAELDQSAHAEMLEWYRRLIALRRSEPDLRGGLPDDIGVSFDEDERWLTLRRGKIFVGVNLGEREARLPLPAAGKLLLASGARVEGDALRLRPDAVGVVKVG